MSKTSRLIRRRLVDWVKCRICKKDLTNKFGRIYRNGHSKQKIYCTECKEDEGDNSVRYGYFNMEARQIEFAEDGLIIIEEET
jgi:hypothetical protein